MTCANALNSVRQSPLAEHGRVRRQLALLLAILRGPARHQPWKAIRNDSVAAFASQHPATVTLVAPS